MSISTGNTAVVPPISLEAGPFQGTCTILANILGVALVTTVCTYSAGQAFQLSLIQGTMLDTSVLTLFKQ